MVICRFFYKSENSFLERAQSVLERKTLYTAKSNRGSYAAEIVFSSPHEVVKTSKQIWIFAQNRFIQDRALQAAVMDAYRSLLMHGEYPLVVINLQCAPDEIDVNIHPTKSQVKFQDASAAFRCVHGALREAIEKAPWITKSLASENSFTTPTFSSTAFEYQTPAISNMSFQDHSLSHTQFKQKDFDMQKVAENFKSAAITNTPVPGYWSSLQILGQANLTYILCQKNDRLIYVDQHAAHERVVFESLMQSWKNKNFKVQDYLFPFVIDLSEDKIEALLFLQTQILDLGIEIERLGPMSLGIKSAPSLIKDAALPQLFEKMANDLIEYGDSYAIEKKIADLFASMACHSVVRAGQSLSHSQMHELLTSMDQFSLSSFCPHGRPVSVETTFLELDKLFGRIN